MVLNTTVQTQVESYQRLKKLYFQTVERGKISYFGLAPNLIRHLISPNQDDLSYSPQTFISGHQIL